MKSLLIGMMCNGEREIAEALTSLRRQTFTEWDLFQIENLPNKIAHKKLYATFMERANDYRYFLKLDGDMVFKHGRSLEQLYAFANVPGQDAIMIDVWDWPSMLLIPGVQAFSNRAKWGENEDNLIVDHAPQYPGKSDYITGPDAVVVNHMPNPSKYQSFRYGIHRIHKAIQPDREQKQLARGLKHWTILKNVWRSYVAKGDERRFWVIMGVEVIFSNRFDRISLLNEYSGEYARKLFDDLAKEPLTKRLRETKPLWENELYNDSRWAECWETKPWR
jgi:hypothetical protein